MAAKEAGEVERAAAVGMVVTAAAKGGTVAMVVTAATAAKEVEMVAWAALAATEDAAARVVPLVVEEKVAEATRHSTARRRRGNGQTRRSRPSRTVCHCQECSSIGAHPERQSHRNHSEGTHPRRC